MHCVQQNIRPKLLSDTDIEPIINYTAYYKGKQTIVDIQWMIFQVRDKTMKHNQNTSQETYTESHDTRKLNGQ